MVYDYIELSPYYNDDGGKHGPYIDEKDLIELPTFETNSKEAF